MASVNPNLAIISIHTLKQQVAGQFREQRLIARLTSFFGVLSLILASIGLYGVTSAVRFLGNQLYGLNPYNPLVTLVAVVTLGLSPSAASLIPALRASSLSQKALRAE